jgi:hypothetical protein
MAIRSLKVQQASSPTLRGYTRSLTRNDRVRLGEQVAHDLPPNRRIRVEQPVDDTHLHDNVILVCHALGVRSSHAAISKSNARSMSPSSNRKYATS